MLCHKRFPFIRSGEKNKGANSFYFFNSRWLPWIKSQVVTKPVPINHVWAKQIELVYPISTKNGINMLRGPKFLSDFSKMRDDDP